MSTVVGIGTCLVWHAIVKFCPLVSYHLNVSVGLQIRSVMVLGSYAVLKALTPDRNAFREVRYLASGNQKGTPCEAAIVVEFGICQVWLGIVHICRLVSSDLA